MQVSAISDNIYRNHFNNNYWSVSIKGNDSAEEDNSSFIPENNKDNDTTDNKIYYVNQWKQYCHKQIKEGNLDISV